MKHSFFPLKRRDIIGLAVLLTVIVGYFVFLCGYSRNDTMMIFLNGETDLSQVRVECSNDQVVKVNRVNQERFNEFANIIAVDLESIGRGDVTVSVYFDDIYEGDVPDGNNQSHKEMNTMSRTLENDFHVTFFGTIYNLTTDSFHGLWTIKLLIHVLTLILIIQFCLSFRENTKKGNYTYSLVTLGGLIFFLSVTLIFSVYITISTFPERELMGFINLLYSLSQISTSFIYVTIIPLLIFCLLVSLSNLQLVRHEGFSIHNLLGVILGLVVIGGVVLMWFLGKDLFQYPEVEQMLMIVINMVISFLFCYLECMLVSTIFCALSSTRYRIREPMNYIIILGCAIRSDGSPTPILRGRIDRALSFDKEQFETWHQHARFVPSGGQGSDEVVSEAECIKRYLMEQGVEEDRILKEDRSVNTYQNLAFSKKVIENDAGDLSQTKIAFSTTNYHVFRGYILARRSGLRVKGLSSPTKLYFFPNAFLREFIGLLFEQKFRHLLIVSIGILIIAALYMILLF